MAIVVERPILLIKKLAGVLLLVSGLLLTALVNGLTLLGVSQFYQPLSVGVVVVLAAFLTRYRK